MHLTHGQCLNFNLTFCSYCLKFKHLVTALFIDFELKNPILNSIMKKSFELGLNKIAKSFEERAIKLYK